MVSTPQGHAWMMTKRKTDFLAKTKKNESFYMKDRILKENNFSQKLEFCICMKERKNQK